MRFNALLPVAAITAVTVGMLSVSAPAKAATFFSTPGSTQQLDLTGTGATFVGTNITFTNPTVTVGGATSSFKAVGFSTSPATTGTINNVTVAPGTVNPALQLLNFSSTVPGTGYYYTNYTSSTGPANAVIDTFQGYFLNGGQQTPSQLALFTSQNTGLPSTFSMTITAAPSGGGNQSIPESSPVIGLLAVGLVGIGAGLKSRKKHTL